MAVTLSGTWRVPGRMVGKERVHRLFCLPSSPAAGIPPSSLSGASRLAFPIDLGSPLQGGEKAETPASPRNSTDYPLKEGKFLTVRDKLHGAKCHAGRCPVDGIRQLFMEHPFAIREVKRIVSQLLFFRIRERQASEIALHHSPDVPRDGTHEFQKLQI